RAIRDALKSVENARNHLQHMRGDLSTNEPIDYPILGALSWTNGEWCYCTLPAQPFQSEIPSIAFNIQECRWATNCQYTVKRISIDIPGTLDQMRKTYVWLVSQMQFAQPSDAELKWGKTESFRMRIEIEHPP
ncbi:MAG: hypothetical protein ACREUQ_06595, partial [Burkholderiales bacterium]